MSSFRQAVLKKIEPEAFHDPLIKRVIDHAHRMATDPKIRADKKAIDREVMITFLPALAIATLILGAAGYWAYRIFPALPLPVMCGAPIALGAAFWFKVFGPSRLYVRGKTT